MTSEEERGRAYALAKLDPVTARLFACGCAYRALRIVERDWPGNFWWHARVDAARRYAVGEATEDELIALSAPRPRAAKIVGGSAAGAYAAGSARATINPCYWVAAARASSAAIRAVGIDAQTAAEKAAKRQGLNAPERRAAAAKARERAEIAEKKAQIKVLRNLVNAFP